jgi:hypothetical protein
MLLRVVLKWFSHPSLLRSWDCRCVLPCLASLFQFYLPSLPALAGWRHLLTANEAWPFPALCFDHSDAKSPWFSSFPLIRPYTQDKTNSSPRSLWIPAQPSLNTSNHTLNTTSPCIHFILGHFQPCMTCQTWARAVYSIAHSNKQ